MARQLALGKLNNYHTNQSFTKHFVGIPPNCRLPNADVDKDPEFPYVIVGDDAFLLETFMIKPYPGRNTGTMPLDQTIFNYR